MSTKKNGTKACPKKLIKEKAVEDDRTRQEEITDFLNKYERNFVDAPVKDLRHIISLFLMEVYSDIYGQYSRKVRGLWAKQPDGWPSDVPFVDPNNKMKGEADKNCKPKKDACVQMLQYLYIRYQTKRGLKVSPRVHCKPDPLISTGTFHPWRSDSGVLSPYETDDSIQLQSYKSYFSDVGSVQTETSEIATAVSSIDESMNAHTVDDFAYDYNWKDVEQSQSSMFPLLNKNTVAFHTALQCDAQTRGAVYVGDSSQFGNKMEVEYDSNFVDLSQYDRKNPLIDSEGVRNIARQGIVFNDNNCIATIQIGVRGPQQVVENDLAVVELPPETKKGVDGMRLSNEVNAVGVKQDNEKRETRDVAEKGNEVSQGHQVEDNDEFSDWDPLADLTRRIWRKVEHIQRQGLLQKPLDDILNNASFLLRHEIDEQSHCTEFEVKQHLVNRAHTLEGIIDILLHLKSLPAEWEEKLKSFSNLTAEKGVMQSNTDDAVVSNKGTNEVILEDVKHHESATVNDPSVYNIKCRNVGGASQPLPISYVDPRPVPTSTETGYLVKSGLDWKDQKIVSFSSNPNKDFMLSDDSCMLPDDLIGKDGFFDMDTFSKLLNETEEAAGKDNDGVKKETNFSGQEVDSMNTDECLYSEQESMEGIATSADQPTSDDIFYSVIVQESSVLGDPPTYYLAPQNLWSEFSSQPDQSYNTTSTSEVQQCTDQWEPSAPILLPASDIVQSLSEVSLRPTTLSSSKVWASDGCRPVMNDSAPIPESGRCSVGIQSSGGMTSVGDRSIMRGILKEGAASSMSTCTKRKLPDTEEVVRVKPQVIPKPKSPAVYVAPIPTFVTNADLDDPHFSSHYRKKARSINK